MTLPPLRLGVTGHRWEEEPDGLRTRIDRVMAGLCQGRAVGLATALAEGADRLVAEVALDHGARLVAVLPRPRASYESDFSSARSRRAFRGLLARAAEVVEITGPEGDLVAGYAAAGQAVLERSDVLVAIWDGRPARGVGGTAGVVAEARDRGIPVMWISAEPPFTVTALTPDDAPGGVGVRLREVAAGA